VAGPNHGDRGNRRAPGGPEGGARRPGGLGLSRIQDSNDFELVHPRCVLQMRPDYEEGLEIWKAGDPEAARDALRYALEGCGDNLWIHVALGRMALQEFRDPTLARGHFGYAFELVERALPRRFTGRLPRHLPANRPFYEAAEGLVACYEALGQTDEAAKLRAQATALRGDDRAKDKGP
jgi:tetratricopeptide (TPR) repeat protein